MTGASGFIGGHLAERLVTEGHTVRCLVRATSDTRLLRRIGAEIVDGELGDVAALTRAAAGCRWVLHCAALVSDWASIAEMRRINVQGTRNVLAAATAAGAQRVLHVSSTDVYGHPGGSAVSETFPPARFSNWYSRTKLEAEAVVRETQAGGRLETVILRPATVYGPRSVNVVGEIARAIRAGHMLLVGGGRTNAGLCYVSNLVDAAVLALSAARAAGETFNVTDGLDVTWRTFLDDLAAGLGCRRVRWSAPYRLARGVGFTLESGYRAVHATTGLRTPPLLSRQAVEVMGREQSFSNAKLVETLGWQPRVSYEAGVEATMRWLSEGDQAPR